MSMRGPLGRGVGGEYGQWYRRRRRRRAPWIVLGVVVLAALLGGGWYLLFGRDGGSDRATAGACASGRPTPSPTLAPAQVEVQVLNGTLRAGLARRTADELRRDGFRVQRVGNVRAGLVAATTIRFGPAGRAAAETLRPWLPAGKLEADRRTGSPVDLILGEDFTRLRTADQVRAAVTPRPSASIPCP